MVESPLIRPCTPAELPTLIALLDEEFIFSKGRSVSLARRFPALLHAGNCANLLLALRGDEIAAGIAIKRFDWITPERRWRGAMMGMVYTRPAERGRGLASQLLRAAEHALRADGTDFAVLWAARPGFYQHLGWTTSDCGVFGTWSDAEGSATAETNQGRVTTASARATARAVEALRLRSPEPHVPREPASYLTLPPPAERLQLLASPGGEAYAIYGALADQAYIYEFGGEPSAYAVLWTHIRAMHRIAYINVRRARAAHQWLAPQPGIHWREQALATWMALAEPACARHFPEWYVPFLDRI